MDATQLTLLLSSRLHASARTATATGDDALGQSKAFAEMLDKHVANRVEERRAELNRQQQDQDRNRTDRQAADRQADRQATDRPSWRNTSAPLDSHPTDDTTTTVAVDDAQPAHPEPTGKTTAAHQAGVKKSDTASDAAAGDGEVSIPRKVPTQHEKTDTKNAGNPEHPGTVVAKKTADQSDDTAGAIATVTTGIVITKQDVPLSQLPHQGGDGKSGDGSQNGAGSQQQDGSSQGDDGKTAAAEAVEATVLAGLIMPQTTTAATGAGAAIAAAAGIPATPAVGAGKPAAAGSDNSATAAASQALATAAAALQNNTAQAAQALAAELSVPGSSGAAPIAGLPAANQSTALPATPGLPGTALGSVADAEDSFSNAITKKLETATPGAQDNVRITATRAAPDNAQMPRPLVRVDDTKPLQASVQPAPTVARSETVTTTTSETTVAPIGDQSDYLGDTLHTYSPYSSLIAGGVATVAAKQADSLTALRQQLANMSVQDQVSVHMQRAIRDSVDKISIQLSPTELGHIHVKMNVDDDKQVSATITVERPATLELLQRDTKALERALQEAGLKADSGSLSFSLQRGNQGDSSDTPGWGRNGRQIGSSGQENSAAATEVSSVSGGNQVDTANGLVNVAV